VADNRWPKKSAGVDATRKDVRKKKKKSWMNEGNSRGKRGKTVDGYKRMAKENRKTSVTFTNRDGNTKFVSVTSRTT
jgi:hypothetical protein